MLPVLLLDGGFSNELAKRCSYDVDKEPLWTAKALLTDPEAVTETHLAYLKAGADIIETATYQATLKGLQERLGISTEECEDLIKTSVNYARTAVKKHEANQKPNPSKDCSGVKMPSIAGSIGPYGVYLHDGSEYNGSYMEKVSEKDIIDLHGTRIELLLRENVDLLALETMPSLAEVEILLKYLEHQHPCAKAWVSFTLQENDPSKTVCGELVTDAFKTVSKYSNVWGFGTNCINPKNVTPFLKFVAQAKKETQNDQIRIIVYPNVGRVWNPGQGWSNDPVPPIAIYATEWMELGANVIGGCCLVGPDEINQLRLIIDRWNNQNFERSSASN